MGSKIKGLITYNFLYIDGGWKAWNKFPPIKCSTTVSEWLNTFQRTYIAIVHFSSPDIIYITYILSNTPYTSLISTSIIADPSNIIYVYITITVLSFTTHLFHLHQTDHEPNWTSDKSMSEFVRVVAHHSKLVHNIT